MAATYIDIIGAPKNAATNQYDSVSQIAFVTGASPLTNLVRVAYKDTLHHNITMNALRAARLCIQERARAEGHLAP